MPTRWDVTKAVRASDLPAPSRLVMLVLADVAEVGTAEIPERFTPSLTVLARETGLGKSTVAAHLAALETAGWVVRHRPYEAAMARGERTRYRLTVPGAGGDPVPLLDTPGTTEGLPLSRSGTGVVQERDGGSPGAGHLNKEVRSESDQSDPFGPPPAAGSNGKARPETTQDILAAFIEYCAKREVNIRSLRGQYAKTIKEALDAGHEPNFVKNVLARMLDDRVTNHPSWLRNRLVEAQTGPERDRRTPPNAPYRNPANQDDYDDWNRRG
jgi:DNA-binding transcriptional ArsR family regulator